MDAKVAALINGHLLEATSLEVLPDMHMEFHHSTMHINVLSSGQFCFTIDPNLFKHKSLTRTFRRGDIALLRITVGGEHFLRCCRCDGIEHRTRDLEPARSCCIRLCYDQAGHWQPSLELVAERLAKSMNRKAQLFLAHWLNDYDRGHQTDSIRGSNVKLRKARNAAVKRSGR